MLREKEPFLQQLRSAMETCFKREENRRLTNWQQVQEDLLYRAKQVGELIGIGDYQPLSGGILQSRPLNEDSDEFGRRKPVAVIRGKAVFTHHEAMQLRQQSLADSLSNVITTAPTEEDNIQPFIVAQRLDQLLQRKSQQFNIISQEMPVDVNRFCTALHASVIDLDPPSSWTQDISQISAAAETLLIDAAPEIADLDEILKNAHDLRSQLPESFYAAYLPLSLAQIIEHLAFVEMCQPERLSRLFAFWSHREADEDFSTIIWSNSAWVKAVTRFVQRAPVYISPGNQSQSKNGKSSTLSGGERLREDVLQEHGWDDDSILWRQVSFLDPPFANNVSAYQSMSLYDRCFVQKAYFSLLYCVLWYSLS